MKKLISAVLAILFVLLCFVTVAALPDRDLGDVNGNGKIDMTDYILVKRAYFGTYSLDEEQHELADINNNRKLDMTDYILLKRMYFGTYSIPESSIPETSVPENNIPAGSVSESSTPKISETETSAPDTSVPGDEPEKEYKWEDDNALKILAIGNSFSIDSLQYVYQIADNIGIEEIVIGNLYIGGCSIDTHVENITNDNAAYDFYYNSNGVWQHTANSKISTAILAENWDYISMQQASGYSGVASSYEKLPTLIAEVKKLCGENTKLVWNMTWAYQQGANHWDFPKYSNDQMTMYNAIVSAVNSEILTNKDISMVIPTGTAIQNARTSFIGDTVTRDGYHLSLDLGRYIAGVAVVRALTGLSVDGLTYAPDGVKNSIHHESYISVAIECANNAVNNPYAVTNSQITESESFDFSNYIELDLGLTANAYYHSLYSKELKTNDDYSAAYYATRIFTKGEIPVGSIIMIQSGWKYRPEGWESIGTRPDEVSVEMVTVTEEWWGTYTERAFNISKTTNEALTNYAEIALQALKIYIPKE